MTSGIYLLQDDNQLIEMTEQAHDSEAVLQQLLEDHHAGETKRDCAILAHAQDNKKRR